MLDETTIAIPDLPGNNRLDTLTNMLHNPRWLAFHDSRHE